MRAITKPINTSFRGLQSSDVESMCDIEKINNEHPWSSSNFVSSVADNSTLSYGLFVEQKMVGYVLSLVAVDTADLLNIGIHPNYKRLGCGKMLLDHLLVQLKKMHINDLILEVRVINHIAINFYENQGFKGISTRERYYANQDDAKIMKLLIPN